MKTYKNTQIEITEKKATKKDLKFKDRFFYGATKEDHFFYIKLCIKDIDLGTTELNTSIESINFHQRIINSI